MTDHTEVFKSLRASCPLPEITADAILTAFYRANGPCCAGCDYWHWLNSRIGTCHKAAPVSGADRVAGLGVSGMSASIGAGHPFTERGHYCGDFRDTDPTGDGKGIAP